MVGLWHSVKQQNRQRQMKTKVIKFVKAKDTKHMVKFDEQPLPTEAPVMNNIYIAKWFIGEAPSVEVEVRVA